MNEREKKMLIDIEIKQLEIFQRMNENLESIVLALIDLRKGK
tara:strand:- start:353 stop:478 length:126 start_codon:yes stop_codon:yes gene_type:complete